VVVRGGVSVRVSGAEFGFGEGGRSFVVGGDVDIGVGGRVGRAGGGEDFVEHGDGEKGEQDEADGPDVSGSRHDCRGRSAEASTRRCSFVQFGD
jgi:hypothetical protein